VTGCNALFSLWSAKPLDAGLTSARGIDLDREFADRGFELVRLAGTFDALQKFNVPLLMPVSEEQGGGYLAVLGRASEGQWRVAPAYRGRQMLSAEELNELGVQMALLPWKDFAAVGYVAVPGARGENVRRLQFLLGLVGCVDVPTDGRYNRQTIDCIKSFQRERGLVVDGLVGPRTLIMLYQSAGAYNMPGLS